MGIREWYAVIAVIAAIGQTLFVLLYMTFPWYRTFLGRALFIKALTLMALLDAALVRVLWGWDKDGLWIVTLYGAAAFGIWAQFTAFAIQRFGNKDQDSTVKKREYHHGT